MRFGAKARKALVTTFVAGIGTVGIQDVDADGSTDFTRRGTGSRPRAPRSTRRGRRRRGSASSTSRRPGSVPRGTRSSRSRWCGGRRKNGATTEEVLNELVRPSGNIPKAVRELTGITNEMVAGADTIDQVLPRVAAFVGNARIVSHNAHFDRRFAEQNARRMGRTFTGNEWVCTMRMAQRVPTGGPYKLWSLAERLEFTDGRRHRALGDCRATMAVYTAMRQLLAGEVSLAPLAAPEDEPVPMEVAYDADLGDQVFVFTGFRDEVLAARIQNAGGAIRSGISRSVTTLLTADASAAPSGKVRKALEYGIAVRRKADFEREFYIAKTPTRGCTATISSASSSWIPSRVRPRLERREGGAAAGLRPPTPSEKIPAWASCAVAFSLGRTPAAA